jgi:uncharacterized protein YdhG (YjbR/CyaY superfamily)
MTTSRKPRTVAEYLNSLPPDRKKALSALRKEIRRKLPRGYEEALSWGMISYEVPLSTYPDTYNGRPLVLVAIASQKSHFAVYLMCAYMDERIRRMLQEGFKERGLKLDMGKSCLRFKKMDEAPLQLIGKVVAAMPVRKFIAAYEAGRG